VRARKSIQLCRSTMACRRLKYPSFVDFVVLSCSPRDFSAIFGTKPISLGFSTEEGLGYASAKIYSIMYKHNGTPSSQISIFCRYCRVIVRAASFLHHFWHNTHFPWHSDRGGSQLCEGEELFNYVEALWHAVVSKIHLLSILSCYRARRGISPSFLALYQFPLTIRQRRHYAERRKRKGYQ